MIRVLEFFGQDVTKHPEVLAKCFADTTADVVKDAEVIGLPTGCFLGAGSEVTTANGTKARLKSDGNWVWLAKADLITRTITENGTYEAEDDNADGYVEVTVNVPEPTPPTLIEKSITANGEYDPADDEADGYSGVTVNVQYGIQGQVDVNGVNCNGGSFTAEVPEGVTTISSDAFYNYGLTSITLPSTLTTIASDAFSNCSKLQTIICKATVPPQTNDSFSGVENCVVYVPEESVSSYESDSTWENFSIQAIPTP